MGTPGQNGPGENQGSCSPPGGEDLDLHGGLSKELSPQEPSA